MFFCGLHSTEVAYLCLTRHPWVWDPVFPKKIFRGKIINDAEVTQQRWLEESGQWLENVHQTHLVLASGKPVLQKTMCSDCQSSKVTSWQPRTRPGQTSGSRSSLRGRSDPRPRRPQRPHLRLRSKKSPDSSSRISTPRWPMPTPTLPTPTRWSGSCRRTRPRGCPLPVPRSPYLDRPRLNFHQKTQIGQILSESQKLLGLVHQSIFYLHLGTSTKSLGSIGFTRSATFCCSTEWQPYWPST